MKSIRKIISFLLALVMVLGTVPPMAVSADAVSPAPEIPAETAVRETTPATEVVEETTPATEVVEETTPDTLLPETEEPSIPETTAAAETIPAAETEPPATVAEPIAGEEPETVEPAEGTADETASCISQVVSAADSDLPDNEDLFRGYAEQVFYGNSFSFMGTAAGERLTGDEKVLYDALVPVIRQIANGQRESTVISVGQNADVSATFSGIDFNTDTILNALLADLPFELYWFDKTTGMECLYWTSWDTITKVQFTFAVAENYGGACSNTVDTAITGAAVSAANNARSIVTEYAGASDYQKLMGYRDEICELVSYDHYAADSGTFSTDNDPWQLIHVFDGNSTTNVVCEGYSKAFMYLCDLTEFRGEVNCYTVTGGMYDIGDGSGGGHMWNVVTLEGKNYLVDVTNSDTGTIGQRGGLFLVGGSGSAAGGYTFLDTSFQYDSDTKSIWGTGTDSILTLAASDYTPGSSCADGHTEVIDEAVPATCTTPGLTEGKHCSACGEVIVAQEVIPAGHVIENGVCTRCHAYGTCGESLTWTLDETGLLTISGSGAMDDFRTEDDIVPPWAAYSSQITGIVVGSGVTSISDYAFANMGDLYADEPMTITLSEGLQSIGRGAFAWSSIGKLILPSTVRYVGAYAFGGCERLYYFETLSSDDADAELVFSTLIGEESASPFDSDSRLRTLILGNTVKDIPRSTFRGLGSSYKTEDGEPISVTFSEGLETIGDRAFSYAYLGKVILPGTVRSIGEGAFSSCEGLYHFEIQDSTDPDAETVFAPMDSEDPVYTFDRCTGLKTIILGNTVKEIAPCTFLGVGNAYAEDGETISLSLSEGLETIGASAFAQANLGKVVLPSTVRNLGADAFGGCERLYYFETLSSDDADAELVFSTLIGEESASPLGSCGSLRTLILGNTVKDIPRSTFRGLGSYYMEDGEPISVTFSEGLETIGDRAFSYAYLGKVILPSTVRSIGEGAFSSCEGLYHFEIQDSTDPDAETVFSPMDSEDPVHTFDRCTGLKTIILGNTVKDLTADVFSGVGSSLEEESLEVSLSNSLKTIGAGSFVNCETLYHITIPGSVVRIGHSAFAGTGLQKITFLGDAPVFDILSDEEGTYYVFDGVTAEGFHPAGNSSWTEAVKRSCGGNITWAASCAAGHAEVIIPAVAPTCTESGLTEGKHCSVCGEVITAQTVVPALDHTEVIDEAKDATCTETGLTEGKHCSVCDEVITAQTVLPALGHTEVIDAAVEPNCTNTGLTEGKHCSVCDEVITAQTVLPALGHTEVIDEGKDATCTEDGLTEGKHCSVCDEVITAQTVVPALGHTEVIDEGRDATCTEDGLTEGKHCSVCGEVLIAQEEVSALDHLWDDGTVTLEPTEDDPGIMTYSCARCGETKETEIPALEHVHQYTPTVTAPTYTEQGYTTYSCTCGDSYVDEDSYTDALGLLAPVVTAEENAATGGAVLTWEAVPEADGYDVYRATSKTGKYTLQETVTGCSFHAEIAAGKTYYYKVKAVYEEDPSLNSGYSVPVKAVGKCAQPEIAVEANETSGKPVITWEKIPGAKKYEVYRAASAGGTYKKVKTTTSRSYTDTSAAVGTTYFYKLKAVGSKSTYNSVDSQTVSCTAICAQPVVTLKVDAATGKPSLTWKAITGAAGYEISRAEAADGIFTVLTEPQTALSFADTSAAPDTDYWYQVRAIGAAENLNSAVSAAKMIHATLAKPAVTFEIDPVDGKPVISWEAVEGAVEYTVYRSTKSTKSYKAVATTEELDYTDASAAVGKGYYYKVIAVGEASKSAYSAYGKLIARCAQTVIDVTAGETSGKPVITWEKVTGAKKYEVYRSDAEDGTYKKVKTTTSRTYTDTAAVVGTTYFYKVRALGSKSAYNGEYSESQSCLTVCAQPAVTLKTAADTGKPVLSWKAISGATGYEILRSENGSEYVPVSTQAAVGFTDETAVVDGKYSYKVTAVAENPEWNSWEALTADIFAACAQPVVTIALDGKKPLISWEAVDGAVTYDIYRSTKKSSGYKKIATVEDGESCTDSTAKKGKTYYYKVVAVSENASSAYSAYVKIKSK